MAAWKRRSTIVAVLVVLIAGLWLNEARFIGDSQQQRGIVQSVQSVAPGDTGIRQLATVKLEDTGEVVSASVLPACVVFAGQRATLAVVRDSPFTRSYLVIAAEGNET